MKSFHSFGRRDSIKWPPRSPDLTLIDFFFWGVVNSKMYKKNFKTMFWTGVKNVAMLVEVILST